jgi:hypothetical protein
MKSPWTTSQSSDTLIKASDGTSIAKLYDKRYANLILGAPELLEKLTMALEFIQNTEHTNRDVELSIRKTLWKVKGE